MQVPLKQPAETSMEDGLMDIPPPDASQAVTGAQTFDNDNFGKSKNYHVLNFMLTGAILGLLIAGLVNIHSRDWHEREEIGVPCLAFCAFFYVVYLIECCMSSVNRYLRHIVEPQEAMERLTSIRLAAPTITFHVSCYHYRTVTESYTDSKGNRQTRTRTEKVVTYSGSRRFNYAYWTDGSDCMAGVARYPLTKVKLDKTVSYLDADTDNAVSSAAANFRNENRYRDVHMDFWQTNDIPHFTAHLLCVAPKAAPDSQLAAPPAQSAPMEPTQPCWLGWCYFWLLSLCLLSWPYRMVFESRTGKVSITVRKMISIYPQDQLSPDKLPYGAYRPPPDAYNFPYTAPSAPGLTVNVTVHNNNMSAANPFAPLPDTPMPSAPGAHAPSAPPA